MKTSKALILDFGSQVTKLIARKVRELNVYSEIVPFNIEIQDILEKMWNYIKRGCVLDLNLVATENRNAYLLDTFNTGTLT